MEKKYSTRTKIWSFKINSFNLAKDLFNRLLAKGYKIIEDFKVEKGKFTFKFSL